MSDWSSAMNVRIDNERCDGCGECIAACRQRALRIVDGIAHIDAARCDGCQACLSACPQGAILLVVDETALQPMADDDLTESQPSRLSRLAPTAKKVAPWVGAALAFVGREVLPRLAQSLLDSWDRRRSESGKEPSPTSTASDAISPNQTASSGGRGRRWRGGRG